jgi:electron transfer flavoprotein alpha subunit
MILVIAEARNGKLNPASWEAVTAAQAFDQPIKIAGPPAAVGEIAAARCEAVYAFGHAQLLEYTADAYTDAIVAAVQLLEPLVVFAAHTYQARDVMPRVAARLDRPLITDCIGVTPGSPAVFKRPMFQSKLVADVVPVGPAPHFVTVQIGAFRGDAAVRGEKPAEVATIDLQSLAASRQKPEAPFREAKQAVDLTQAPRIVSVGRGIKGEEHIQLAKDLAAALGAEIAASRPIVDSGWLPPDRQIGSSGQTVAPKLYLALGISGAIQHVVGMKGAKTIVAINKDPDAPIFEIADYGIVGDLFEIVPAMIAELKKA